jgi:hypothetical protein
MRAKVHVYSKRSSHSPDRVEAMSSKAYCLYLTYDKLLVMSLTFACCLLSALHVGMLILVTVNP